MERAGNGKKRKRMAALLVGVFAALGAYVFLHEGGHCLVALMCGAEITEFNLLGAYMAYSGGRFTELSLALFHGAGCLLPYCVALAYALVYPAKNKGGIGVKVFSTVFCAMPAGSLLVWIVAPVLYLYGKAPQGEDVTKFLDVTGIPPVLVSVVALALVGIMVAAMVVRGIPQAYYGELKAIKEEG